MTADRLYAPDDTVTRGRWGTVVRIADDANLAGAREGGQVVEDGLYACPGDDGPTEAVYWHDGSSVTLRGTAAVVDCFGYGSAGFMNPPAVRRRRADLVVSGLVCQGVPGRAFEVDVALVRAFDHHRSRATVQRRIGRPGLTSMWAVVVGTDQEPIADSKALHWLSLRRCWRVPRYEADESTAGAFVIDLSDGLAEFVDRVKVAVVHGTCRAINHNVFERPSVAARMIRATPGEILAGEIRSATGAVTGLFLVDTSTGAVAYFDDLVKEPHRATLRRVNGRPAEAIASNDGNFALVMRRGGSGVTEGAYLYHATTGECVYFARVNKMASDPTVGFVNGMPEIEGGVAAIALQDGGEATTQALLIDEASGAIYGVGGLERDPSEVTGGSAATRSLRVLSTFSRGSRRRSASSRARILR